MDSKSIGSLYCVHLNGFYNHHIKKKLFNFGIHKLIISAIKIAKPKTIKATSVRQYTFKPNKDFFVWKHNRNSNLITLYMLNLRSNYRENHQKSIIAALVLWFKRKSNQQQSRFKKIWRLGELHAFDFVTLLSLK